MKRHIEVRESIHDDLKTALKADRTTISDFARSLQKPDGSTGVTHTVVIRVAQGHDDIAWIRTAIINKIRTAKKDYPAFYKQLNETG